MSVYLSQHLLLIVKVNYFTHVKTHFVLLHLLNGKTLLLLVLTFDELDDILFLYVLFIILIVTLTLLPEYLQLFRFNSPSVYVVQDKSHLFEMAIFNHSISLIKNEDVN